MRKINQTNLSKIKKILYELKTCIGFFVTLYHFGGSWRESGGMLTIKKEYYQLKFKQNGE